MTCAHLQEYKLNFGVIPYKTVCNFFIRSQRNKSRAHKPLYHQVWISCFVCGNETSRIFACLHCIYLGCYGRHLQEHKDKTKHVIFVEMSNGFIFCCDCKDYVYDNEFEEISSKHHIGKRRCGDTVRFVRWHPSTSEDKILKQHSKRINLSKSHDGGISVPGMRGMVNLGSTCFMNCIMQALLHTPMLRDYFFADKHKCYAPRKSECLVCHFGRLFQKYYDEGPATLSLHELLYIVWQNAHHLSGYDMKDAHEFFIAALNLLHQFSTPKSINMEPCTCIIDVIFHGKMQSDLVCQSCGNISTTVDPIWDISLDIPDPPTAASLFECLHHFTRPEPLGSSAKIKCTVCETYQESTKQLTFKTLPIVIVIHLKRFEHDNSKHKKKTMYVPFPIELDMSPFMSGYRNKNDARTFRKTRNDYDMLGMENRYTLYAVIVHTGTLDTGHYLAYIKHATHRWFKCSDVSVHPAGIDEVMASEGYLLFYHKTLLTYK